MGLTESRAHRWTAAVRAMAALGASLAVTAAAPAARAEILAYDEHDGEAGGAVGWLNDWPFARSGGELVQTAGYQRRYFSAPLSAPNTTLWIAITGRMGAQPVGYAYHVPMGVTSWTTAHQHHGLHFDTSSTGGLLVDGSTVGSGVVAITQQTWLARYQFGPASANGRFNATVSVWSGSGAGRSIDPGAPPAAVRALPDTTLDSLYASHSSAADTFFVERESVATSAREALAAPERDLYVVAHQDDDLLFMNPDIADSIQAGNSVQTVYVTAGAGGNPVSFVYEREAGMKAAYASMAGLPNTWSCASVTVAGKGLVRCGLNGSAGRVGLVFLRLPSSPDTALLSDLWSGSAASLPRFDDASVTYTRADLIGVLSTLMTDFRASRLGILNSDHGDVGDHTDHYHASLFAFAAHQAYAAGHGLRTYRGYDLSWEQENLSGEEFDITWDAFRWYAQCDKFACSDTAACGTANSCDPEIQSYIGWARRRYVGSAITGVSGRVGAPGGKCLQVAGGSAADGAPVQIADCAGAAGQRWTMLDGGQVRGIEGKCLAVAGGNAASGTPLVITGCDASAAQGFAIQHAAAALWSQGSDFSDAQLGANGVYTRTVRLGDVNGDGRDDACVRRSDGVWCALSNGSALGPATRFTQEFSDAHGWAPDAYGQTLQLGDINGDGRADLCGRGVHGILCQVASASGAAFVASAGGPWWAYSFSDAQGFNAAESYYRSIRLGDVDGDGLADVCGRGVDGVRCAINTGSGGFGAASVWLPFFSDANGWLPSMYGATLQLGDINGDGMADACARGPHGVACAVARAAGPGFERAHVWSYSRGNAPDFGDGSEFDATVSYHGSLHLADLDGDGDADLCGRGASGALCALSNGLAFGHGRLSSLDAFTDAAGWLPTRFGATVQLGDVDGDGRADLCGRAQSGIWCALAP